MKFFNKEIKIQTKKTFEFVKITPQIQEIIDKVNVENGILFVRSLHTTAGIVVTEDDPPLHRDFQMMIEKTMLLSWPWQHIGEGIINARAHQIALLLGNNVWAPVIQRRISLGTWQDIFIVECLEGRRRRVEVTLVSV